MPLPLLFSLATGAAMTIGDLATRHFWQKFIKDAEEDPEKMQELSELSAKLVQASLLVLGYDPKEIDGYIGNDSTEAAKQFQASNRLEVNGKIDTNFLERMIHKLVELGEERLKRSPQIGG